MRPLLRNLPAAATRRAITAAPAMARALVLALGFIATVARPGSAQRVLGPSQDATTLRRGTLRTSITGENVLLRGRWNDGESEALGAGLGGALDMRRAPELLGIASVFGGLGIADVNPSLGDAQFDLRQRLALTHLGLEYGISDRVMLRLRAPFVRARAEGSLGLDGTSATAGLNPTLFGSGVAGANRVVVDAYSNAANSLAARRDECSANAAAHPECAGILAEASQVNAAIARATQLATALAGIYGADGLNAGMRYVPMAGSVYEGLLGGIATGLRNDYARWGAPIGVSGNGLPLGAQAPIGADVLNGIYFSDPALAPIGFGAEPLRRSTRQNLGDVDLGVTVNLYDDFPSDSARFTAARFGLRHSLSLTYRLGGGHFDLPDNLVDLGTGSGHDAIALHAITDVLVNDRLWTTVTLGWAKGAAHERDLRLPIRRGDDLIEPVRLTRVSIAPADMWELRIAPRYVLNDYIGLGGEWRLRARGEDAVRAIDPAAMFVVPGVPINYGDGAMQTPSDANEQRWAWTVSYSTLDSKRRGVARLPLEIFYTHEQSIGSSRGIVPRRWEDRVQLRFYTRLFGR
ncbi:MAG: hypothetical protein C0503_05725 [Gemmatimonas sp.]|nr:hypothetical protein [Gemmatimonas sp.]